MAKKKPEFHGWLNINKPLEMSSHHVVSRVRRAFGQKKVGHAGTLDPLATGVLPIALGGATKTVPYMMDAQKVYTFTVKWGESTTTDDREGEVVNVSETRPTQAGILEALPKFIGMIEQVPPAYSAIKINGERAYKRARNNEDVSIPARSVVIHDFVLESVLSDDEAAFRVRCGKGTYVRSLVRDLAIALGTVGHVSVLNRVSVGPFWQKDAISLDSLDEIGHKTLLNSVLLPVAAVLDDIPDVRLTGEDVDRLRMGQKIFKEEFLSRSDESVACFDVQDHLVAIGSLCEGVLSPKRVFNN